MKRLLLLAAVILLNIGATTYAVDDRAGAGDQEQSLVVKNWKGEPIGTSKHVVLDSSTGMIVFVIVSLNQGGNREIAVPPGLFSLDRKNEALVLSIGKKELYSAPEYHASNLGNPEFVREVYRYFGIGGPWTEETPQEKKGI